MSESFPSPSVLIPIEPNRRLLQTPANRLKEFYSNEIGTRIISLPAHENDARSHEELSELRLPVFSGIYRDDELWLTVPEGTRTVRRLLRFVARDVANYGEMFYKLGTVFKQLETAGVGFPQSSEERSVLDSFAFAVDENELYGGNIYLTPPYVLNPDKKIGQALGSVAIELEKSDVFTDNEIHHLMEMTAEGLLHG
ncbi:MAG: hypothetical protein QFB87_00525 [Patescibacteria group bacterium]|nr:hypothetical protein [Patescibacteria group bacterium]